MNCYSVTNPTNGQTCTDDTLGAVVYNATDGTWEKQSGYTQSSTGAWSFNLNSLPVNKTTAGNFIANNAIYIIAICVFVGVILIFDLFGKK